MPLNTLLNTYTHTHTIDIHLIPTSAVNPFKRFNSFSTPLSCTRSLARWLCLWYFYYVRLFSLFLPFSLSLSLVCIFFSLFRFLSCKLRIGTENFTFCYITFRFNRENARRRNDKCLPMTYFRMLGNGIYCHKHTHTLIHSSQSHRTGKCDQSLQIKCNFYLHPLLPFFHRQKGK